MSYHRIVCVQTIPSIGQTYNNVFYMQNPDGALTNAQIGAEINNNLGAQLRGFQSWFLGWQFIYVYDADNHDTPNYIYPCNNAGGLAQEGYLYPTTCFKISWSSLLGGRRGRGRTFIAGSRASWATAAGITASAATNGGVLINNIIARYGNSGNGPLRMVIWHRGTEPPVPSGVVGGILRPYLGMQRRRNYGIGV